MAPTTTMQFSNARYLSSKRSVDDRALARHAVEAIRNLIPSGRPRVLELGAGLGTMVARMLEWELLRAADYTLLDIEGSGLDQAVDLLARWGHEHGMSTCRPAPRELELTGPQVSLRVRGLQADLNEWLAAPNDDRYDVLVANAFLDLVDLEATIPKLWTRLAPSAAFWLTINFDGETVWLPKDHRDQPFMAVYHRSMDERTRHGRPAGNRHSGRQLYDHLRAAGASIAAMGASDWAVHPVRGVYPADEAYFMHHMVETVRRELERHAEIDPAELAGWVELRRGQIDRGELALIVHQLDYAGLA